MSRLIDADALEKTLGDWIREHWTEAFTGDDAGSEFMDMIDHEETVDTVQAVHAHWIPTCKPWSLFSDRTHKCSCCGHLLDMDGVNCGRGIANYCPNCGARMG